MTIAELIELLRQWPPETPVWIFDLYGAEAEVLCEPEPRLEERGVVL